MQQTTYEFYKTYLALRLHFTTDDYDIVKYSGRTKRKTKSPPKDVSFLALFTQRFKKNQLIEYMVANFISGDAYGGIFSDTEEGEQFYNAWKQRIQNLSYNFKKDINTIKNHLNDQDITTAFESTGQHPKIMKMYLGKHIMLETIVILDIIYDFTTKLNDILKDDFMWNSFRRLVCKYQPFLNIDKDKYEGIIKATYTQGS